MDNVNRLLGVFLLATALSVPSHSVLAREVASKPPVAAVPAKAAPVVFDGRTLFFVSSKILSLPPEGRAALIAGRIDSLAKESLAPLSSLAASEGDGATDIVLGDLTIMTVTDDDARAAGRPRPELAREYVRIIRSAVEARREAYGARSILTGALYAVLATTVFLALLLLFGRLFPALRKGLHGWQDVHIRALRFQRFEMMSSEQVVRLFVRLAGVVRLLLTAVLVYFYVPLVLSFFPWTRGYSAELYGYFVGPLRAVGRAVLAYVPKFIFLFVIAAVTYYGLKVIRMLFNAVERQYVAFPGFHPEWALPTYKIARFLVIAVAIVAAFPYLPGAGSPAFQGVSVFLGVLLSFGSAGAISNIVAGVILTYMRPFRIGDRVKIADTTGDVIEKTLLVTRIRTIKNEDISVPNSLVLGSHIVNYSTSAGDLGLILHTTVTIGYEAPWRRVHELLLAAADATEHVLKNPKPFVFQTALDDFFVRYELNAYTGQPNRMAAIYAELHQNIQDRFNEGGVEILSPHYAALRDGNTTTVPQQHREPGYSAPGFRIDRRDGGERKTS